MSKDEIASVWDDDPYLHAMKLAARLNMVLGSLAHRGHAPDAPQATDQASAVSAERVVELERQLAEANEAYRQAVARGQDVERQLESDRHAAERGSVYWNCQRCNLDEHKCPGCGASLNHWRAVCDECREQASAEDAPLADPAKAKAKAERERDERELWLQDASNLLRTAYVVREVPWSDVAAGMMTIARDGTPWMVGAVHDDGRVALRNADQSFTKAPTYGETVRVLVPYVTPEQAEKLTSGEATR